jgi:hypothetical protein
MGHFGTRRTLGMSPKTEKTINFCDKLSLALSSFSAAPPVLLHIFSLLLPGTLLKWCESEPAPTGAPKWMDGALMGAPFSSLPVPGLTKVVNSSWPPFFSSPPCWPRSHLPTYLHLDYLATHPGLLAPPPTYLLVHLPTHLPTYPSTYLSMYLCTKSPPRQMTSKMISFSCSFRDENLVQFQLS